MTGPLLTERRGAALWLWLNRPVARNSLTRGLIEELDRALDVAESDVDIRVVVIAAHGPVYCAGADLGELLDPPRAPEFLRRVGEVFDRVESLPKPVVAAVHGIAVAGGLELVLCADLVVAARSARFGDGHANHGLLPAGGGSVRLPRRVGAARAKYLMFTGAIWPAPRFADTDLISVLTEDDRLIAETDALVAAIAEKSLTGIAVMKQLVEEGLRADVAEALRTERARAVEHLRSSDAMEGVRAFTEKRAPVFTGP